MSVQFVRNEKVDPGAIIAGVLFYGLPLLWVMKYDPVHRYELQPSATQKVYSLNVADSTLLNTTDNLLKKYPQQALNPFKNQIKFSPIRVFNILNPGIEISYERLYGKYYSTQLSVAYLTDCFHTTPYYDYSGYRAILEEKFFLHPSKTVFPYISVDIGFYKANMGTSAWFIPEGAKFDEYGDCYDCEYMDYFRLTRQAIMMDVKFGMQFLMKHFIIDGSIGLGAMSQKIVHTDRAHPNDEMCSPRHPNVYYMMENEGQSIIPNIPFTIKIGYLF